MTGKRVGLVIGNNYPNSDKELRFAVADALSMKEVLLNKDICGFDEVEESIDDTFVDAMIKIEKVLKNANNKDLVFIYFSGHGKKHLDNGLHLLFKDFREDFPLATSLNFDYINRCMKYPSLKSVIIVLDCCYSGVAGIKGDNLEETLSNYSSGSGTAILTSTGLIGSSKAKEDTELKHGVFTSYLLEGLENGIADDDEDGFIYLNDLYKYARNKTIARCSQSPLMKTQTEGEILIAKNPKKIKENEYELKKSKLLKEFSVHLHPRILSESLTILRTNYQNPSSLEQVDFIISNFLESLLKEEFSVDNYIEAVQSLKGISISTTLPQNKNIGNSSKSGVTNIGNTAIYEEFKKHEIPETFTSPYTGMEFVLIPAGEFMMGSPSEEQGRYYNEDPLHEVTIENFFYMGKYPVTQKQWEKVTGNNPSNFKGGDRPTENVSWNDVQEFIKILNGKEGTDKYRLPSEAEWEYTCRAGTQTRYSFGNDKPSLGDYAWYIENSGIKTHPVGQKKPNPWGLYDMHGNIWEWVQDEWHEDYNGAPTDGTEWEDGSYGRVGRGGGWRCYAEDCRSAFRGRHVAEHRDEGLGFRLLREYTASEITQEVTEKAKSATTESSIVSKTSPQITNVQKSSFQQIKYKFSAWKNKKYNVIKIIGKKYVFLKPYSQNKLAKLVIDSDDKYALKTGEKVDLGQGYALEAKQIDVDGKKVWLEFTKDGEFVDDQIISTDTGNNVWTCEVDKIQGEDNVPVLKVHVNQVFQGAVDSIAQIDGLWLIDFEDAFTIKPGDKINGYEIMEIADEYISYKLLDSDAL